MTRRYYTDPFAAGWMSKHFGLEVTRTHCHREDGAFGESTRPVPLWILARDIENQVSERVKYYVHPESENLLKPEVGDIIGHHDNDVFHQVVSLGDKGQPYINPDGSWTETYWDRIILREGKPFFWPEDEA